MKALIGTIALFISFTSTSQIFSEVDTLLGRPIVWEQKFGASIDMTDDLLVIGANSDSRDENGNNPMAGAGAVFIYERQLEDWVFVQKIVASDRNSLNHFGTDVAIHGTRIIVGSPDNSYDENGMNYMDRSGAAYVFDQNVTGTWYETQKLVDTYRHPIDYFGVDVDVYENTIIVGAPSEDESDSISGTLNSAGSVFVFELNQLGNWDMVNKLVPNDREVEDYFGTSLTIWDSTIAVGAYREDHDDSFMQYLENAGSAYIFKKDLSGEWSQTQKLIASDRSGDDYFGQSMDMDGNKLVVGALRDGDGASQNPNYVAWAGSAYIFKNENGLWIEEDKIVAFDREYGDWFGRDVSINSDLVLIGASNSASEGFSQSGSFTDYTGAAYLFEFDGVDWNFNQKIMANDSTSYANFGSAVAINGAHAAIGAPQKDIDLSVVISYANAGSVYLYVSDELGFVTDNNAVSEKVYVYPNPASNTLYFEGPVSIEENESTIFDAAGRVYPVRFIGQNIIDVSSLSSGIYFLNLNRELQPIKFIKD